MTHITFASVTWNAEVVYLPGHEKPVPLRLLSYTLYVDGADRLCTISSARTGETLLQVRITDEERNQFSDFQALVLNAKLRF